MKKPIIYLALLIAMTASASTVEARKHTKPYTITDREEILAKKIDVAYKDNQLTLKEQKNLQDKLDRVRTDEQKMKDKNGGKLSYKDQTSLEKELNSISTKLHGKMLDKRVE